MRTIDPSPRLPPLDLLLAFDAAARHLSFTRAAAERHVTQSALSRQVQALEAHVGVPLFERRHRALALTAAGLRLQAGCAAMLVPLRAALADIRAPARREVLALTTTPGLASLWLIPRLASFTRAHPDVDVRIDTSYERRNLAADGFDVAIRYGIVAAMPGAPLFSDTMQPLASPALLAGAVPLAQPADLACHTLLQVADPRATAMPLEWASWLQAVGLADVEPAATLTFSGYGEAVAAAVAGQGVLLGRRPITDDLVARGELVPPFADRAASPRGYVVVVEPAARARPAVGAFERWLLDAARAQ